MTSTSAPLYAFFVGINQYYSSNGVVDANRSLLGPSDDAEMIGKALSFSRPQSVISVLNENTKNRKLDRNSILLELYTFIEKMPEHSDFVFYFAGHASLVKSKLVLHPCDYIDKIALISGILLDDLMEIVLKRKGKKFILLDCCRANIDEFGYRTPSFFSKSPKLLTDENTIIVFSCKPSQYSYEVISSSEITGGIFSHYLSKKLLSKSFKQQPTNFYDIVKFIKDKTQHYVCDNLGKEQTPIAYGVNSVTFEI